MPVTVFKPIRKPKLPPLHVELRLVDFGATTSAARQVVVPEPGEESHFYVVRLTPRHYPFEVHGVTWWQTNHARTKTFSWTCETRFDHKLLIFKGGSVPKASPDGAQYLDVKGIVSTDAWVRFDKELPAPLTLNVGESLYVGIGYGGVAPDTSGVGYASGVPVDADRVLWSGAGAAPFHWASMDKFDLGFAPAIAAYGWPR